MDFSFSPSPLSSLPLPVGAGTRHHSQRRQLFFENRPSHSLLRLPRLCSANNDPFFASLSKLLSFSCCNTANSNNQFSSILILPPPPKNRTEKNEFLKVARTRTIQPVHLRLMVHHTNSFTLFSTCPHCFTHSFISILRYVSCYSFTVHI